MHALAMVLGLGLAGAKAPAPSMRISDFYVLLARQHAIDGQAEKRGGRWVYTAGPDGAAGKSELVADEKANYLRLESGGDDCLDVMELALFQTGARHVVVVATHGIQGGAGHSGVRAFECGTAACRELPELGALHTLAATDFLDEHYAKSPQAAADKAAAKLALTRLTFDLPPTGATVVAHLEAQDTPPDGEDGAALLEASQAFLSTHQRYSWIHLTWNAAAGTFVLGKKGP